MLAAQQVLCILTFQVKEYIGSIVLEHLRNEFNIHVLDVDLLVKMVPALAQDSWQAGSETEHRTYILAKTYLRPLLLRSVSPGMSLSIEHRNARQIANSYDIGDDAHEKQALLMLVGALLS